MPSDEPALADNLAGQVRKWSRVALVANTRSRNGAELLDRSIELLAEGGVVPASVAAIRNPAKIRAAVEKALADGADLVIVGGGDGTISGTIGAVCGSEATFALLPLGTANSFSRSLGMDSDLEKAVDAIVSGRTARIDLGDIDGHVFANTAMIGLSSVIGDTIPPRLKRFLGRPGYLVWAAWMLVRFRPFRVSIEGDCEPLRSWATEVRILNGSYSGGVKVSENPRFDSGKIIVQVIEGRSKWRLAFDWYCRVLGLSRPATTATELKGTRFSIVTQPSRRVAIDGEVALRTPIELRVRPRAVNVVIPDLPAEN